MYIKYPQSKNAIYKISFKSSDKFYIGSSKNVSLRMQQHFKMLKKGNHKNPILQNLYNKYGRDDIVISIIEENLDNLREREQYYLDLYKPYINICKSVRGHFGISPSEETKLKISNTLKQKYKSGEISNKNAVEALKKLPRKKKTQENIKKTQEKNKEIYENKNKERDSKILEMINSGYKKTEIVKIMNVSYSVIRNICINNDIFLKEKNNSGEKNSNSKLTREDVIKVKKLLKEKVPHSEISKIFNVSKQSITSINREKTWKHIII